MKKEAIEVPVFDLTLAPTDDQNYLDAIKDLCERLAKAQNNVLDTYWTVGEMLHDFVNDQQEVDDTLSLSKILSNLSEAVLSVSGGYLDYSDSTLRKMLTFREAITATQLTKLKTLGVPVSKALPMCISDVSDDERTEIIDEIESGASGSAQIPDMVKELHPVEDRKESRGGAGPFKTVKKLNSTLDKMTDLVEGDMTLHIAAIMGADDEGPQVDYLNQLKISRNKVEALKRVVGNMCDPYLIGDHKTETSD